MDRTSALNYLSSAGKRYFQNRNITTGQHGTSHDAADRNAVQEELLGLIEAYGIAPDAENWAQIQQAIRRLAGGNLTTLTASTTLTADQAGVVKATAVGGDVALTLPAADAANGKPLRYTIIRTDVGNNQLTCVPAGADTIEGGTAAVSIGIRQRVTLVSDGVSAWYVIGQGALYGGTGRRLLPTGELMQWGSSSTSSGGIAITFPVGFAAAPPLVLLTEATASAWIPTSNWTIYGTNSRAAGSMFVTSVSWNGSAFFFGNGNFDWFAMGDPG